MDVSCANHGGPVTLGVLAQTQVRHGGRHDTHEWTLAVATARDQTVSRIDDGASRCVGLIQLRHGAGAGEWFERHRLDAGRVNESIGQHGAATVTRVVSTGPGKIRSAAPCHAADFNPKNGPSRSGKAPTSPKPNSKGERKPTLERGPGEGLISPSPGFAG